MHSLHLLPTSYTGTVDYYYHYYYYYNYNYHYHHMHVVQDIGTRPVVPRLFPPRCFTLQTFCLFKGLLYLVWGICMASRLAQQ